MDDSLFEELHKAVADLGDYSNSFLLLEGAPFNKEGAKVAAIAELLDDVIEVGALHDVEETHDVGALEGLEDVYLGKERLLYVLVFLDCVIKGLLVFLSSILMATLSLVSMWKPMYTVPNEPTPSFLSRCTIYLSIFLRGFDINKLYTNITFSGKSAPRRHCGPHWFSPPIPSCPSSALCNNRLSPAAAGSTSSDSSLSREWSRPP
jgi:hypothetical protein